LKAGEKKASGAPKKHSISPKKILRENRGTEGAEADENLCNKSERKFRKGKGGRGKPASDTAGEESTTYVEKEKGKTEDQKNPTGPPMWGLKQINEWPKPQKRCHR